MKIREYDSQNLPYPVNILPLHFYTPHNQPAEEALDSHSPESACFPLRAYHLYKSSFYFLDLLVLSLNSLCHETRTYSLVSIITNPNTICYCCSVAQLCPTLCDPMDCSTPDFPVLYHLLEFAQTPVHRVSDGIQPSHLLLFPSPLAFNLSQHQGLLQWVDAASGGQSTGTSIFITCHTLFIQIIHILLTVWLSNNIEI